MNSRREDESKDQFDRERLKLLFEAHKHMTTLSVAALILFLTLLRDFSPSGFIPSAPAIAVVLFGVSLLSSMGGVLSTVFHATTPKPQTTPDKTPRDVLTSGLILFLSYICFFVGTMIAVFVIGTAAVSWHLPNDRVKRFSEVHILQGESYKMERLESDIVRARRFEVVDDQARVRAAIGPGLNGGTGMQFYGSDGQVRAELSMLEDGSTLLSLQDQSGQDKAVIGIGEGIPTIGLAHSSDQLEESWGISLNGEDPESPETQRCSLVLSQGEKVQLLVSLIGEDNEPCVFMRQGEDLVRVVP